jgi:hypothetical protein
MLNNNVTTSCPAGGARPHTHWPTIRILRIALLSGMIFCAQPASARITENVILITLDGFRWQEVFTGADENLLINQRYVSDPAALKEQFWAQDPIVRRKILLPFLWGNIGERGQIYGNRHHHNQVDISNRWRLSYSGYNELLSGIADDTRITNNRKRYNPNVTILEYANRQPGLRGKVAAFASWDVLSWIINDQRSGIPVNAGPREAINAPLSQREIFLNALQRQIPSPWRGVRLDAFTHQYALEYVRKHHPRLVFIALGETDEYAHDGQYDNYLLAAQRSDSMIRELWRWLQSQPNYRNKTTLLITTDHGRGSGRHWRDHGRKVDGSEAIWLAVIGPDSSPMGEVKTRMKLTQNQLAATLGALLGLNYHGALPIGPPIDTILQ